MNNDRHLCHKAVVLIINNTNKVCGFGLLTYKGPLLKKWISCDCQCKLLVLIYIVTINVATNVLIIYSNIIITN